jgi:hypothetical protein
MFRDEKEVKPIQAADLYAWHKRRQLLGSSDRLMGRLASLPVLERQFSETSLQEISIALQEVATDFAARNQSVSLIGPSKKARQSARRAMGVKVRPYACPSKEEE